MIRPNPAPAAAGYDWIASLAFWLCLVVAAALFATVALAPRLVTYMELQKEYATNQSQLVGMESRAQYLDKVVDALKSDPQFAAEVARIDFDAARPGDERIAVDKSLSLSDPQYDPPPAAVVSDPRWYAPLAGFLAANASMRPIMLGVAAALVLVAFSFFNVAPAEQQPEKSASARRSRNKAA